MHALHTILVHKNENMKNNADIRRCAEFETEYYANIAFDWRETNSAGGWEDEYPENVLHIDKDRKSAAEVFRNVLDVQGTIINDACTLDPKQVYSPQTGTTGRYLDLWRLNNALELLMGNYTFDSQFYDLEYRTSLLTEDRIQEVMAFPEEYAIVLFDYHM